MQKGRPLFATIFLAMATSACQSLPRTAELDLAEAAYADGHIITATRYTEKAIQKRRGRPEPEAIDLHIVLLREAGRDVEADAFLEYTMRYSGQDTGQAPKKISRSHCEELGNELVRSWGPLPQHVDFQIGTVIATFEIGSDADVSNIHVSTAKNPASAWLIIHSIATILVDRDRLADLGAAEYPIRQCGYWKSKRSHDSETIELPMKCMRGVC